MLALAMGAASAFGQTPTMDLSVQNALATKPSGRMGLILRTPRNLTARDEAAIGKLGGYVYRHLPIVRSAAVNIPAKSLRKLLALPFVEHVSQDLDVRKNDAFTVGSSGADTAWQQYGVSGSGVGVAIVDSGIRPDNDFGGITFLGVPINSRVVANTNFVSDSNTANDLCGHGTHVAGIVAGDGASSSGLNCFQTYYGIARGANLVNVRVLDSVGRGTVSQVIAGIQWVIARRNTYNIRVLNLSMGHPVSESYATDPLCQAVEQAWKSGIVVVCSAGNAGRLNAEPVAGADNAGYGTGYGSIQCPGNDPYVITVGAMRSVDGIRAHDQVATYSSRGPSRLDFVVKPDIMAPGNRIVSVLANGGYLDQTYSDINGVPWSEYMRYRTGLSSEYFRMSGTSMSAPVVSGAVALMLQRQPYLTPDTIKARLMISADKWTNPSGVGDMFSYGAGYLNIPAALRSTIVATKPAISPSARRGDSGQIYVQMDSTMWGTAVDGRAMWGFSAMESDTSNMVAEPTGRAMWGFSVWTDMSFTPTSQVGADISNVAIGGDK